MSNKLSESYFLPVMVLVSLPLNLSMSAIWTLPFSFLESLAFILANSILLALPLADAYRYYQNVDRRFTSLFVSVCLVYAIFLPLGAIPSVGSTDVLAQYLPLLALSSMDLWEATMLTEAILLVAWIVMRAGMKVSFSSRNTELRNQDDETARVRIGKVTIVVGLFALLIGLYSYFRLISSPAQYLAQLEVISDRGSSLMPETGSTFIALGQNALIPGVLAIQFGLMEAKLLGRNGLIVSYLILMGLVMVLGLPYGGRGTMIQPLLLSLIILERRRQRITFKWLLPIAIVITVVLFGVLYMRLNPDQPSSELDPLLARDTATSLLAGDLTRFPGALFLSSEVIRSGPVDGQTLFTGWVNLLPNSWIGGERYWRTEDEVMLRTRGWVNRNHAMMLSIPADLYFNLGWLALIPGMFMMGLVLGFARRWFATFRNLPQAILAAYLTLILSTSLTINLAMWPGVVLVGSIPMFLMYLAIFVVAREKSGTESVHRIAPINPFVSEKNAP